MKKIIAFLSLVLAIVAVVFAVLEVKNYNDEKKKIEDNTIIQEVEEKIESKEKEIKEKQQEEEKVKIDKKDKIEELEIWQKKVKNMESNL